MKLRSDGEFALGLIVGCFFALLLVLITEKYLNAIITDRAVFGAIVGALIAGLIGVSGQILVINQAARRAKNEDKKIERAALQSMIVRVTRTLNTFTQCKTHLESTEPFDNITFDDNPPLMKPLKINDLPSGFSDIDLSLPLSLDDIRLFNLMNVFDSSIRNFRWAYSEYEAEVSLLLKQLSDGGTMKFLDGKMSGPAEVDMRQYHAIRDLQDHYREEVYGGMVIASEIEKSLIRLLADNHNVHLASTSSISDAEWQELYSCVDLDGFSDDIVPEKSTNLH